MKLVKEDNKQIKITIKEKVPQLDIKDLGNVDIISITALQRLYNISYDEADILMKNLILQNAVDCIATYRIVSKEKLIKMCNSLVKFMSKQKILNESKK